MKTTKSIADSHKHLGLEDTVSMLLNGTLHFVQTAGTIGGVINGLESTIGQFWT